jgi:hypothetical protein
VGSLQAARFIQIPGRAGESAVSGFRLPLDFPSVAAVLTKKAEFRQLDENVKKARRDVKEIVWRTYKNVMLLGKDGGWKTIDLGLVHSSAANSLTELIVERLRQDGDLESAISPDFLVRNWPPAFKEWSTKSVRDTFFASPQFPRLLNPDSLKDTIARGVGNQILGYVGKKPDGTYAPFHWKSSLSILDVEISADMYIIQADTAKAYATAQASSSPAAEASSTVSETASKVSTTAPVDASSAQPQAALPKGLSRITWQGDVPPQKWMNFYTKVLAKFATKTGLKIGLNVEIAPADGVSNQNVDEIKIALRDLGLEDDVKSE